jgi:polyisoprenoid-binding protein YceI
MSTSRVFASTAAPITTAAPAARYELDPAHSRASFAVRHMMVATVRGHFSSVAGSVVLDDASPERSHVEATIDASTIDTGLEMRDNHLRSADFFDAAQFPQLAFKSTAIRAVGPETWAVTGDLTIRDVTRQVVLDVESPAVEVKDPYGNVKRGASATTSINRKDFGLNWNQALEAGGVMVGDTVKITLDLELVRK